MLLCYLECVAVFYMFGRSVTLINR